MTSFEQRVLPIAVIGAGIIGATIAFELRLAGHEVVLIDSAQPGSGASFGNMGSVAISEFAPISRPSIWRQIPKWLLDPEGPIRVRPNYLLRAAPWFLRFLKAGLPARVEALETAGAQLCAHALEDTRSLLRRIGATHLLSDEGCVAVYGTQAEFEADREHRVLLEKFDIAHRHLNARDLHELEPELASGIACGILIPDARTIANPHAAVQAVFAAFMKNGGRFERMDVRSIRRNGNVIQAIEGDGRQIAVSRLVIAAGARTGLLSRSQGDKIPLETERGYHTQIMAPAIALKHALISPAKAFMVTPVAGGIRIGGTVEIAGLKAAPDFRRARITVRHAREILPKLEADGATEWMGHRPALPDTIPVISRSPKVANLYYATGHGHLGLTLAATTATLMRDLVEGRPSTIDVTPYRVDRF